MTFAAMDSQKSWLAAVKVDFVCVRALDAACGKPCMQMTSSLTKWIPDIISRPAWWKKKLKALCSLPAAIGAHHDDPATLKPSLIADVFGCATCGKVFSSFQQLRLHYFREHGEGRVCRKYIDNLNARPACFRRFQTRTQAIHHLYGSGKRSSYADRFDQVHPEEVAQLDADETLRLQQIAKAAAFQCCNTTHLNNLSGPLKREFASCYKGRPRYDPLRDG